ncbi:fasciclin domain-containing protein [Chitinophaga sp. XS-30]|uniref:fasciclin domain-containing protein n=1 Tax=Chitinophaga sp. XS-30 TaxID=2604421 RepID=UPI0011DCF7A2|nr:fasciclin domain-containing protein [Chitinophaga sp. XS-30]QEH41968.1 hypothetical protein FW415_14235 [Chitinophaga sp. XS-30]
MKRIIKWPLFALLIFSFASCKKNDYLVGGDLHNPQFNGTTYEYLQTNPLFDTLLLLIDRTGLQEEVNAAGSTFFAPSDYSIQHYVKKVVQARKRLEANDENLVFEFSELDFDLLKDSLRAYLFPEKIERTGLTEDGAFFSAKDGEERHISLRDDPTGEYQTGGLTIIPQYIYFSKVIGTVDPIDNSDIPEAERDTRIVAQTTGILTTNGVLHVLANSHIFTFATEPK